MNDQQPFVSPLPLHDAFAKKRLQELREKHAQGIFDTKFKYTPKERKEAINKWLSYFPDMKLVDNKRIGRLIGPFYIGIVFVTDNDLGAGFKPHLYAANICEPEVKTGFTIIWDQGTMAVTYKWPEEVILEYVAFKKRRFFIPTEGSITLDEIFNFFVKFKEFSHGFVSEHNAKAPVLIATWAGEPKKAQEYYEWVEDYFSILPKPENYIVKDPEKYKYPPKIMTAQEIEEAIRAVKESRIQYLTNLRELMKQPDKLRYNFIESVKALKLEKAAYQDIAGVSYRETYFQK